MRSVLNIEVSCFKNYNTPGNPRNVNLLHWLTSNKYRNEVLQIRSLTDKSQRDKIKSTLPAITPSGIFTQRNQDALQSHSGLIQFDIDLSEENKLITNWNDLKSEISKIQNIAYVGLSVSGKGYWGLIPIPKEPENHKKYFEAINEAFFRMGIKLDPAPKNPASLRGYSFDAEAYFNHEAKLFQTFLPKPIQVQKPNFKTSNPAKSNEGLENWLIQELRKAPEGERHLTRLKLSRLAGGLIASGNFDDSIEEKLIEAYKMDYAGIDSVHIQSKEISAIKNGIKNGRTSPVYLKDATGPSQSYTYTNFQSQPAIPQPIKKLSFSEYTDGLKFENGILINGFDYPADWDTISSFREIDLKTKDFIKMTIKNPALLTFSRSFDLQTR
jgi:hypothetical protein